MLVLSGWIKALGDTVFRVGCDLQRKLGADDRFMAPLKAGITLGLPVDRIAEAVYYGTGFRGRGENGKLLRDDAGFHQMADDEGLQHVLIRIGKLGQPELEILTGQFHVHGVSLT